MCSTMLQFALIMSIPLALAATPTLAGAEDPGSPEKKVPVELRHLGYARDKAFNVHSFRLKLSNQSDKPLWVLLPGSGDEPSAIRTRFGNTPGEPPTNDSRVPPSMLIFDDAGMTKVAIGVDFYGFRAVRLPARSAIEIPEFNVTTHRETTDDLHQIAFDGADELLVNGKTPLEKWLPFEVGVFKEERLSSGVGNKAKMESEKAAAGQKKYVSGTVEYIEAKAVRRWTIKFQNNGEKR